MARKIQVIVLFSLSTVLFYDCSLSGVINLLTQAKPNPILADYLMNEFVGEYNGLSIALRFEEVQFVDNHEKFRGHISEADSIRTFIGYTKGDWLECFIGNEHFSIGRVNTEMEMSNEVTMSHYPTVQGILVQEITLRLRHL